MPEGIKLLTVSEAAERLGINEKTLRKWADHGQIPVVRLPNGYRRFEPAEITRKLREMGYRGDLDQSDGEPR
jgi:excisionase family DNA binding protein